MIEGKPVVLFIETQNENGCNWYRLRQPALKMIERENVICALSRDLNDDEFGLWLDKADVVFSKVASPKLYHHLKERPTNKKFVFDLDDDLFSVDPFNPAYEKRGIKEVDYHLPDGRLIQLRDGQNGFNIKENKKQLWLTMETIKLSDAVVCASAMLSGKMKRWNKNTHVIKNFMDFRVWNPLKLLKDEYVRVGYQGGWAHFQDFWEVRDVLLDLMNKHENMKLILMGQTYEGALKGFPMERVESHGWVGMECYPWKFKSLNIDIGIAPLNKTDFNISKSELKWEEYSALGIATVAQNCPPYSLAIRNGETGFVCSGNEDWFETLGDLIEEPDLRKEISENARTYVREHYNLEDKIKQYERLIVNLVQGEKLLTV